MFFDDPSPPPKQHIECHVEQALYQTVADYSFKEWQEVNDRFALDSANLQMKLTECRQIAQAFRQQLLANYKLYVERIREKSDSREEFEESKQELDFLYSYFFKRTDVLRDLIRKQPELAFFPIERLSNHDIEDFYWAIRLSMKVIAILQSTEEGNFLVKGKMAEDGLLALLLLSEFTREQDLIDFFEHTQNAVETLYQIAKRVQVHFNETFEDFSVEMASLLGGKAEEPQS